MVNLHMLYSFHLMGVQGSPPICIYTYTSGLEWDLTFFSPSDSAWGGL